MAQPQQTPATMPPRRGAQVIVQVIVMAGAGLGIAALLAALALWFHYGTAVFFETIAAGISACF